MSEILFLPLGGTGEIGINCNLYGYSKTGAKAGAREWIMVDLGASFTRTDPPGVEIITPDIEFITQPEEKLLGLFLTHGHEDHIGAVAYLWPRLQCPVYATPFTAELVKKKLSEHDLLVQVPLHIVPLGSHIEIGAFTVDYIHLTHSIAEPNGFLIKTEEARIFHTGDWKIDKTPVIGEGMNIEQLQKIGKDGVDAIICDSTNALNEGRSGSEAEVARGLEKEILAKKGRVVVTAFASNLARLASIGTIAQKAERDICLLGRSMHKVYQAGKDTGYLKGFPSPIDIKQANALKPEKLLVLSTGSQGEPQTGLAQLAHGRHPHLKLAKGDAVIFSSKTIPGSEVDIYKLYNQFLKQGVEIITSTRDEILHVSGHPCRDELRDMYKWIKPRLAIPVHGEPRHLIAHAQLATELGVNALQIYNGDMVRLAPAPAIKLGHIETGRCYIDGKQVIKQDERALKERRDLSHNGVVFASIPVDKNYHIQGEVKLDIIGAPMSELIHAELIEVIKAKLSKQERGKIKKKVKDKAVWENLLANAIRRHCKHIWGKRPLVKLHFTIIS